MNDIGTQGELELAPPAPERAGWLRRWSAGVCARWVLHWAPIGAPLVFLGQLVFLGLLPAQAEGARLDRSELEVRGRVERLQGEEAELASRARMLSDEVFQQRVRRSLVDPSRPPLTLDRARNANRP